LYIVNIQWTPKDTQAKLKIHGYCDEVLKLVVQNLQEIHKVKNIKVNSYNIKTDPLFKYSIKLKQEEMNTTSKIFLASRKSNTKKEQSVPASLCTSTASTNSWYNKSFKPKNIKKSKSCLQLKQETTTEDNIESTSK
jgi:NAD-dependent deacetylase sirtuin 7